MVLRMQNIFSVFWLVCNFSSVYEKKKRTSPKVIILTQKGNQQLKIVNNFNLILNVKITPVISQSQALAFKHNSIHSNFFLSRELLSRVIVFL